MILLLLGLTVFLGLHSVRIFANNWRTAIIEQRGEGVYKGLYSAVSLIGLILIIVGYGLTRSAPVYLWTPPAGLSHVAALLVLLAFIFLAAANIPGNRIKAKLGHPMILGTKLWAFGHLLANGRLGDLVLFGSFLVWAIVLFGHSRRRDRRDNVVRSVDAGYSKDALAVVLGTAFWFFFVFWAHQALIGVSPFGA